MSSYTQKTQFLLIVAGTEDRFAAKYSVEPSKNQEDRELSCWATNEMGNQKEPCDFSIKVASNYLNNIFI